MADTYDVAVIGAGPGGYIAAIRAAQLGFSVACIDDWVREGGKPAPGGTCTNVGCIPSKALLQSSEHYEHAGHAFAEHGIGIEGLAIDVAKMLARKAKVVAQNNDGILYLFKKHKIRFLHGRGAFAGGNAKDGWLLKVVGPDAGELAARHVIVATGSTPRPLPGVAFDGERILDNAGALAIAAVPKRLGVVGRGRHRARDGERVAQAGRRGHGAGGAAGLPRRSRRGRGEGSPQALRQAGPRHSPRRVDHDGEGGQARRQGGVEGCRRCGADRDVRHA